MRDKGNMLRAVILLLQVTWLMCSAQETDDRNKRTVETFLRNVADAFGYDILKRPPLQATTTPAPQISTFPPPPVQPQPAVPRGSFNKLADPITYPPPLLTPLRLNLLPRGVPAQAPPPPPPPPPVPPKAPPAPAAPPRPPVAPARPPAAPQRPPRPPPKAPPPAPQAPPPPPPAPPSRPTPIPPLRETFQKTLNLNFNWNKNVGPAPPPGSPPAAPPPAPPAAPPPPPQAPAPPPPPPPRPPAAAPPPRPPAAAPPPAPPRRPLPSPGGQTFLKKPQLYTDYAEYSNLEDANYDYGESGGANRGDLTSYHPNDYNQVLNQDYSETSHQGLVTEPVDNQLEHLHLKQQFQDSVADFWKNYPLTNEKGYKYIAAPEQPETEGQFSVNFVQPSSRYEEYPIVETTKGGTCTSRKCMKRLKTLARKPKPDQIKSVRHEDDEGFTRIYLIPRDFLENYDEIKGDSNEAVDLSKFEITDKVFKKRNESRGRQKVQETSETIAHPLFSGLLPAQLHQSAVAEAESRPFPVPFDYDATGSESKIQTVAIAPNKEESEKTPEDVISSYGCCQKSSGDFDFYTVPEPAQQNDYSQQEKLFSGDDEFSEKAKILTSENKKSVHFVKADKFDSPLAF